MIWVKDGVHGAEELAKLLNSLEDDERYEDWDVLVECVRDGEIFYTVIFSSEEIP